MYFISNYNVAVKLKSRSFMGEWGYSHALFWTVTFLVFTYVFLPSKQSLGLLICNGWTFKLLVLKILHNSKC